MIIKSYELNKIDLEKNKLILFYGKNEGFKEENIDKLSLQFQKHIAYDEKDIIENQDNFFNNIFSGSLFEESKLIKVNQTTDKIFKIIEDLIKKNERIQDTLVLLNADLLEKKSKLRVIFEKSKELICVPYYPDTNETLFREAQKFLKEKKIAISPVNINYIIGKSNGDRKNLNNELRKIEMFSLSKREINIDDLQKLVNISENVGISELIDNCLAKDKKKTLSILNDNNFGDEESIIIARTLLNKTKRIFKLVKNYQIDNDLERTINNARPVIFWKDKPIVKKQIAIWEINAIKELIININNLELQIKKNNLNSMKLITNLVLETAA